MKYAEHLNQLCENKLPDLLDIKMIEVTETEAKAQMLVQECHLAPNDFLHAGSVVSLADTACGNGCLASMPEGARGFTTVELKSNHIGTAQSGIIECVAKPVHKGRTTQVWDATVTSQETGKIIALFRCTQMIFYPE